MKNTIKILLFITFFFSGSHYAGAKTAPMYDPAPGPYIRLISSGKANAQIIIPSAASYEEEYAANELQKYFSRISGGQLPVTKEGGTAKYPYSFYIGKTKKASDLGLSPDKGIMGRDGFQLRSVKNGLVIFGNNDLGSILGVYELLERYFDVRWFMPGEEYVPEIKNLKIGQVNVVYKPSFDIRWVGEGDWAIKQRMNAFIKAGNKNTGINWKWNFHSFYSLMTPSVYYKDHPEYYALVNGKRTVTDSKTHENQLCTSNPDVIREVAKNLIDTLNAHPGIDIIALSPNDGGGFCECENCKALDEPNSDWFSQYSNRLAVFESEVAKIVRTKHPEVLIKVGAYAMYARPPRDENFRPETNLFFQFCHLYFCHNHPLGSDLCKEGVTFTQNKSKQFLPNQDFEKMLDQWLKISPHLFIYEYYQVMGITRANLPWPLLHTIKNDIPYYYKKGVEGFYTQTSNDWPRLGLNFYLAAKLTWNASLDPDAVLDDYFSKFYGPAAKPMKDFFMSMETSMQDWNGCVSYGLQGTDKIRLIGLQIFTDPVMQKIGGDIALAEKLSSKDAVAAKHVAMMKKVYEETKTALVTIKDSQKSK